MRSVLIQRSLFVTLVAVTLVPLTACRKTTPQEASATPGPRPSILLVTLDTTRADAIGPSAKGVETPSFNALAARGRLFRQAYATVPQTLPSHTSMMTGLYPGGHGVHENARFVPDRQPLLAEKLHAAGYRTAAFVSAFAVARRFGIARGFDLYDEDFGQGHAERDARATTERALAWLGTAPSEQPLFLWVHYYDPHFPYTPPEPFRTRYAKQPYLGEVAFMDQQLGRLVEAFEKQVKGPVAVVVVSDHGEGLGDHGEQQHGNLLYQSSMHVPLLILGPGVKPAVSDKPVSTRRVFQTICDWAGVDQTNSLRASDEEVVLGEAMRPFLDFGWQPQTMGVEGRLKVINAGRIEVYDVIADPAESHDLAAGGSMPRALRAAIRDYPVPSPSEPAAASGALSDEEQKKLASLGYVGSTARAPVRADAPRPAEMVRLFPLIDLASGLFVREQYADAIPLLRGILSEDPNNLDAQLRLATSYSSLGRDPEAVAAYERAQAIAPGSRDVRNYLALHYARGKEWQKAVPMLEQIVAEEPDRVPALEALAVIRERQGRIPEATALREKIYSLRTPAAPELVRLAGLHMQMGDTAPAIAALEKARAMQGAAFANDLELGVLYLASHRYEEARAALDRVPPSSRAWPMALFKRAQVSVLLREPDASARIAAARRNADATTRELIARERLFGAQ